MTYRVKCPSYTKAVSAAMLFGSLYSEENVDFSKRQPVVLTAGHKFIFVNNDKKYKQEITLEEFVKKYFKGATQKSQAV